MAHEIKPGICVIGADPGALFLAAGAAALEVPVVLVENGTLGSDWFNKSGWIPAKALIAAAERAEQVRTSGLFGVKAVRSGVNFAAVSAHMQEVINTLGPNVSRARIGGLAVHVISGAARFVDRDTIAVGDFIIKAERFVIATGSAPFIPDIPGLLDTPHLTTENLASLSECPRHLIVIGAGTVGLELAQAFRRLGADVTVLEAATPLATHDPECVAVVLDALDREGIKLRTGVEVRSVSRAFSKIIVEVASSGGIETVEGSHLLVAAGRRPNLTDVNIEAAGIRHDAQQGIAVDERLRTSNRRVYAIGGVTGGPKYAHVAIYHAGLVIRNALFRLPTKIDANVIPWVTYTDPELAEVGMREHEARKRAGAIRVLRWPYRENDRAQCERATTGHIKIITSRQGAILGVTIVGAQAGENISTWTLAISQNLKISALASLVVPYPSYAEMGKYAALNFFSHSLTSPRVRRMIALLRRLG